MTSVPPDAERTLVGHVERSDGTVEPVFGRRSADGTHETTRSGCCPDRNRAERESSLTHRTIFSLWCGGCRSFTSPRSPQTCTQRQGVPLKLFIVAVLTAAILLMPTGTQAKPRSLTNCEKAYPVRIAVTKQHGKRAPGRNVCRYGVRRGSKVRPASDREKAAYLCQLRKLAAPAPYYPLLVRTAVPPKQQPAGTLTASVSAGGTLGAIAQCESGNNPRAVSPGGTYRGLYQFDYGTWASVGGSGDPAAASPAEQHKRAAILYSQRGAQPWPVCGR